MQRMHANAQCYSARHFACFFHPQLNKKNKEKHPDYVIGGRRLWERPWMQHASSWLRPKKA